MKKVIYIKNTDLELLTEEVNKLVDRDWVIFDQLVICHDSEGDKVYIQAMVLPL